MVPLAVFEVDPALIFTIVIQLCSVAVVAGVGWSRLNQLDKEVQEVRTELKEYRIIREDLAVIKSQLLELNRVVHNLFLKTEED